MNFTLPMILGKDDFKLDLYDIKNLLITGQTGIGKTTLLKSVLKSIDDQPTDANCKIVLIDTKDFDFNGYTSKYLITPVITDATKAAEYLSQIRPSNADIAIIIDELADLIAVKNDIQDTLVKLAENPKIHIISATRRGDLLSAEFMKFFHNRITFDKIGCASYFADKTIAPVHFKTV